MTKTRWMENTE